MPAIGCHECKRYAALGQSAHHGVVPDAIQVQVQQGGGKVLGLDGGYGLLIRSGRDHGFATSTTSIRA